MSVFLLRNYVALFALICLLGLAGAVAGFAGVFGSCLGWMIGVVLAACTAHLLLAVPAMRIKPDASPDPSELALPQEWMTGLCELAKRTADQRGLPPPAEVRLHCESLAHVYEDEYGRGILVIGAPALSLLSADSLSGIIAHELAHLDHGHSAQSRRTVPYLMRVAGVEYTFARMPYLADLNPLCWLLRGLHFLILWDRAKLSRQHEFEADQASLEQVGPEEAAKVLLLLTVIEQLPLSRLSSIAETFVAMDIPLERMFHQQAQRARHISAHEWQEAARKMLKEKTGMLDSHPCLAERLKAIGVKRKRAIALAGELQLSGDPARTLVDVWDPIEKMLTSELVQIVHYRKQVNQELARIVLGPR